MRNLKVIIYLLSVLVIVGCGDDEETDSIIEFQNTGTDEQNSLCINTYHTDLVCEVNENECTFYAETEEKSCFEYCQDYGGTCFDAYSNSKDNSCEVERTTVCGELAGDQICTCSVPAKQ